MFPYTRVIECRQWRRWGQEWRSRRTQVYRLGDDHWISVQRFLDQWVNKRAAAEPCERVNADPVAGSRASHLSVSS